MADVRVALQTIVAVRIPQASVNNKLHLAAWTSERLQGVAASSGDVVMLRQIVLECAAQRRTAFLPRFFRRDTLVRFVPEILGPAVGFEQKQLNIIHCGGVACVIGDVAVTASGADSRS